MGAETRGSSGELCGNLCNSPSHPLENTLSQIRWIQFMCGSTAQGNRRLREHTPFPGELGMHRGEARIQKRGVWNEAGRGCQAKQELWLSDKGVSPLGEQKSGDGKVNAVDMR